MSSQESLGHAIDRNDIEFVKAAFASKVKDVQVADLLVYAAARGTADMTRALIILGADVCGRETSGYLPIDAAAAKSNFQTMDVLLEHGAQVNPVIEGRPKTFTVPTSPLWQAAANNNLEMLKYLISHGADPNQRIHNDATSPLVVAVEHGHHAVIETLLDSGLDFKWKKNLLALSLAAKLGNEPILRRLLQVSKTKLHSVKAFVNSSDLQSPVEEATKAGHVHCLKTLVEYKADLNACTGNFRRNRTDAPPTILAVCYGQLDALKYLLSQGAEIWFEGVQFPRELPHQRRTIVKGSLLDIAVSFDHPAMIQFICDLESQHWGTESVDEIFEPVLKDREARDSSLRNKGRYTLRTLYHKAKCLVVRGHIANAKEILTSVVQDQKNAFGEEDEQTMDSIQTLAGL